MEKFTTLQAVAAPLVRSNIDTDMIIPKQFLKTITRTGLGQYAFYEWRTLSDGTANPDFILNQSPYNQAQILVAGTNFGCGSSREHAPWALLDFGFRCVIAPAFADIFYNNCFENGILPAIVTADDVAALEIFLADSPDKMIAVSLVDKTISYGDKVISFQIDDFAKHRLLNGLDTIGLTLTIEDKISAYEAQQQQKFPWLA